MTSKNFLAILALLCGCASVTREGSRVRIVKDPVLVKGCKYVDSLSAEGKHKAAMNKLKNTAAKIGTNRVLISTFSSFGFKVMLSGDAYICKTKGIDIADKNRNININNNINNNINIKNNLKKPASREQ